MFCFETKVDQHIPDTSANYLVKIQFQKMGILDLTPSFLS